MKKSISLLLAAMIFLSVISSVYALGSNQGKTLGNEKGTNTEFNNKENVFVNNQNKGSTSKNTVKEQNKNMNALMMEIEKLKNASNEKGNNVRVRNAGAAIQGLKLMNQYTNSSVGQKVSQIANRYEKTYQEALSLEEKIEQRSTFSKLLFGGDKELAESLKNQVRENEALIEELKLQLNNASEEEKEFIMEQIKELKAECERLENIANEEANRKGLFRWW